MEKSVFISGKRTPFGAFGGSLKDVSTSDLGTVAGNGTLEAAGVKPEDVDHVILGQVNHAEPGDIGVPRQVTLKMGIPIDRPSFSVNRLCGSGFQSWISAAQQIATGEAQTVLAGGAEQMSAMPYIAQGARWGARMGHFELTDTLTASLTDPYCGLPMAITAENLAEQYDLSREACDEYSYLSQTRCKEALEKNYFADEITGVTVKTRKAEVLVEKDEHPKPDIPYEKIQKMKSLFKKDGTVTAATASGIVDGAATSLITSESFAKSKGLKPRARIVSWASVGCDPKIMGIGPAYAIPKALQNAGLTLDQMDLIEVNEAFAAQYLAVEKELGLPRERTNVNGGAIAIGHPLGATGGRIMNHLVYELERRQAKYALGSACIGGGQGIAVIIERL